MWKTFKNATPDSGDTILVLDTETDEMGVMIYMDNDEDAPPALGLAGYCYDEDLPEDIEITETMLWISCPFPSIEEYDSV